jgi:pantoate kinase
VVNGDPSYDARTTRRAVGLLLGRHRRKFRELALDQTVDTPIGSGFGSSAAAATSAVYAAAAALGLNRPKRELALFAHRAEIIEQTGLGTVSVVYDGSGAGVITEPGEPGVARFVNVAVPRDMRIVTACLAPFDKKLALSSPQMSGRINALGREALAVFLSDPSLESLAGEGERFSKNLGLESPEVRKLESIAKASGATHASQNMIGYSIHALVDKDSTHRVAGALTKVGTQVRVDAFEVGRVKAGVARPTRK